LVDHSSLPTNESRRTDARPCGEDCTKADDARSVNRHDVQRFISRSLRVVSRKVARFAEEKAATTCRSGPKGLSDLYCVAPPRTGDVCNWTATWHVIFRRAS